MPLGSRSEFFMFSMLALDTENLGVPKIPNKGYDIDLRTKGVFLLFAALSSKTQNNLLVIFVLAKDEMVSYNLQHGKFVHKEKHHVCSPRKKQLRSEIIQSLLKFLCCSQLVLRS